MRKTSSRTELLSKVSTTRTVEAKKPGAASTDAKALSANIAQSSVVLCDATIFATKDASNKQTVKMFESADDERAGVTNVAQAKTAKDLSVLVGELQLLAATAAADINGDPTNLAGLNFGSIAAVKGLENGELTIRHGGKVVLDRLPLTRFKNSDNERSNAVGVITLDNVIEIRPQEPIEATIDFGTPVPNRTALKFLMLGTQTLPS